MLNQTWIQWKPSEDLAPKYYIDSILDDLGSFEVILSCTEDRSIKIKIHFEDAYSYRGTNKNFRKKLINLLDEKYGPEFVKECSFFKVTNSDYLDWFREESCGWCYDIAMHFSIVAENYVLDIIASYEPKVSSL